MNPRAFPTLAAARAAHPAVRVLDVRDGEAFERGHLTGPGHCPLEGFAERRMELPARAVPVLCVHDDAARAHDAADRLVAVGFAHASWLAAPLAHEPDGTRDRAPAARLWSPSAFLERVTPRLVRARALDLACGTARTAVWLALHGHEAEAWDVDPSALARAAAFAARSGVRLGTRVADLERDELPARDAAYDTVVVQRYLHRPLWPWIERALAPGCTLVVETFLRGQERFGHPSRDRHLLERGELAATFAGWHLEVIEEDADDAPPVMARLLARRQRPEA
ncbi:MAG: methyltransferase domain-containing protein [bacterium]